MIIMHQQAVNFQQYAISNLKHKHSEVLYSYIEVGAASRNIPEYVPQVMEQSINMQVKILHGIRAIMKDKKKLNTSTPEGDAGAEEKKRTLMNRIKVGVLYDDYARIKRFMLIYVNIRLDFIDRHFYTKGWNDTSINTNLVKHEKKYKQKYRKLLAVYSKSVGLDLFSVFDPPNEYLVEYKVTKGCQDFMTEKGEVVALEPGSVHYMPRSMIARIMKKQEEKEEDEK